MEYLKKLKCVLKKFGKNISVIIMDVTKKYFYAEEIPERKYYKFFSENMQLY